ncbi:uncharacterized protein JN550_010163 [Neoarthrinium moseri]|uniref:uncharacterized protein n=1 Tax=Neoarthrinium moseri TaxID=1658444 RepID=UPI001FDBD7CC|nr:uncharacterized protein JN550_010163 [Neoarthrinium moseri]KAI1862638.1 hypothetical protein JN550_010163 [Neoarthrinium moseri]
MSNQPSARWQPIQPVPAAQPPVAPAVKHETNAEIPPESGQSSQAVSVPAMPQFPKLEADPEIPSYRTRVSSGHTQIDWSGFSYEDEGRLYQGYDPGAYSLPNDGAEQDRLDFQHTITGFILDGRLNLAPIVSPKNVLDIGAGTAERNPDCLVTGTDLCLIQAPPNTSNCIFILENSETQEWAFPYTFDYIHIRNVGPCFDDIRTVLRKSYEFMTPGGWIELQDGDWQPKSIDGSLEGTALQRWFGMVIAAGQRMGRDMLTAPQFKDNLLQSGFVAVQENVYQIPSSAWARGGKAKRLGRYVTTVWLDIVDSYHKFLLAAGHSLADVDELVPAVKRDLLDLRIHWHLETYFVYGRKCLPRYGENLPMPSELIMQRPAF